MQTRRVLLWAVTAIVAVDLIFFSGASNFLASPQSRILNQALILGAMVVFLVAAWRGRIDVRSPLVLPGAAWIVANLVAAALSQRPAASLEGMALLLLSAPAYLVIRGALGHAWLRERLDWLVIVATLVFVCAFLGQAFAQWIVWWKVTGPSIPPLRPGDVGLTVGTVNAVALYLELLVPVAVWLSWQRWRSRPFSTLLAVLGLVALVITGSRGAWLGAMAGAVALAALAWRDAGRPRPTRLGGSPAARIAVIVVAVAVVVVAGPLLLARLLSGDAGRFELYGAAWSMFTGHPLTGVGPGAWQDMRPLTPISDAIFAVLATSHDSVLQVLAELGVLGAAAAAWLLLAVARQAWRAINIAPTPGERRLREICAASLIAALAHSLVDTQVHIPAVVILTMYLVARLDPVEAAPSAEGPRRPDRYRRPLILAGAAVLVGAVLLVPIDVAMIRAQSGNIALDRGDPATAAAAFDAAVGMHDLPAYRLGQGLARARLGDGIGAADAFAHMDAAEPFTFVAAERALLASQPAERTTLLGRIEAGGPYDATAILTAAILRYPDDPAAATQDLAGAMAAIPTLVYSTRPVSLFDDGVWSAAQDAAVQRIGQLDPVEGTAVAILAGRAEAAARQRARLSPGPEADAVDLLAAGTVGPVDLESARVLLRRAPGSLGVQNVLAMLGFKLGSQPLIDAVRDVAFTSNFAGPLPPMELVIDGRVDADWSARLPRYPQAAAGRIGPKRPYIVGMVTIEPVFRPR